MICPHCGNQTREGVVFCTVCGKSVNQAPSAPPQPPPSVPPQYAPSSPPGAPPAYQQPVPSPPAGRTGQIIGLAALAVAVAVALGVFALRRGGGTDPVVEP